MGEILHLAGGIFDSRAKFKQTAMSVTRTVKEYEIELIEKDYFYSTINGERVPFRRGSVMIAKPGEERNSKLHFKCRFIHLTLAEGVLKEFFDGLGHIVYVNNLDEYVALFDEIVELSVRKTADVVMTSAIYRLAAMLAQECLIEGSPSKKTTSLRETTMQQVAMYLEEHLEERITLQDLGARFNLHPNYIQRAFQKTFGESPLRYLLKERMARAKYLLLSTDATVTDIAEQCGFDSQTYFSNVFSHETGCTPTGFRAQAMP